MSYEIARVEIDAQRILNYASDKWTDGKTMGLSSKRQSNVVRTDEAWIYDIVKSVKHGYNFRISAIESLQITRYAETDHYDFHYDGDGVTPIHAPSTPYHGKTHKLSMSILLNDEYEGGEFEFYPSIKLNPRKGEAIVFPSYMLHRVLPVTQGIRYSLVAWFTGDPFV